ncbi:hypothetical protein [Streptomyces sp. NPDC050121]|uniref:hypothetical protein n=1 Tax=Streptomyces sp. NPDC050121 TaxID=3365601 RepID=UPI0037A6888D
MARAEAERAPAALPSVVVSANRATLRDRIADTVTPFLANFSDEEAARINAAEVADALLAVLPAPAPVCICGHSKQQHFEDACITEITGCNCGDYLEPQDAAEVIDRWRQAALHARATNRATLLREAAEEVASHPGPIPYRPQLDEDGGFWWDTRDRDAVVALLRRMADCPACETGIEHDVHCPTPESHNWGCGCQPGPSRVAAEEQPAETQAARPEPDSPRCAACTHPKRDHDGRADHRARFSPLVAGEPWCHACKAPCDYAERPAVGEQPDTQTREAQRCPAKHGALGRICKLPLGHTGMHTGSGPNGGAVWDGDAP